MPCSLALTTSVIVIAVQLSGAGCAGSISATQQLEQLGDDAEHLRTISPLMQNDEDHPVHFGKPKVVSIHGGTAAEQDKSQWHSGRDPRNFYTLRGNNSDKVTMIGQLAFNCEYPCSPKHKELPVVFSTIASTREPFETKFSQLWTDVFFGTVLVPSGRGSLLGFGPGIPSHTAVGKTAARQWLANVSTKGFNPFANHTSFATDVVYEFGVDNNGQPRITTLKHSANFSGIPSAASCGRKGARCQAPGGKCGLGVRIPKSKTFCASLI